MPKMDGFDLVGRLTGASAPCNSTIMMLTSGGQRGDAQRCQALGIAAYLLKPVRQAELREAIIRVLSSSQSKESSPMITRSSLRERAVGDKTLKILLAEDNLVNQKLASRLLEKRNHSVTAVLNGREALAALEQNSFDLVLMDMQMPEMDGFEATRRLRDQEQSTGKHQPVIAMTALAMNGDRERCMAVGMDAYLSKPIRPQELDEILDSFLVSKGDSSPEAENGLGLNGSVEVKELLDRLDDDRTLLAELLEIFRREYPDNLQAAQQAINAKRPADLKRAGHTLKGALANLSATNASALAAELESIGRASDVTGAQAVFTRLVAELGNVIRSLESLCPASAQ
jgi:two-component system, sensor histidine kinase and response regulator